jgi:CRISPR/Cas system-associated exonuclease Cas4 (RecB family)
MAFEYRRRSDRFRFNPQSKSPFKISRSKIALFDECPRCFYLDQRLGIGKPATPPFSLNAAVDELMKKEFDICRRKGQPHPIMVEYGIDAVPFKHEDIEEWRDALRRGIKYYDPQTNLVVRGGIDDVWIGNDGKLIIVDYKATSKKGEVTLDAEWQDSYKRQIEVYQWLFQMNGFNVSDTGYFVYVNGDTNKESFSRKLEFDVTVIPYKGSHSWIPETLENIASCLQDELVPAKKQTCSYCAYREEAGRALLLNQKEHAKKKI